MRPSSRHGFRTGQRGGLLAGLLLAGGSALAGPEGGEIVGGTGSISVPDSYTTQIDQMSSRLAINWDSFNVAANESVIFNQPSASAIALNRILDQNPSTIYGSITANGHVFLINVHGVLFAETAHISVGGLMVSTLDMNVDDFMAGHYELYNTGISGAVVNRGVLQAASGGSIALVGGSVENSGLILADYGRVTLAGADRAFLDFDGDGLLRVEVTGELREKLEEYDAAVANTGTIQATGGKVVLEAAATRGLFDNLINSDGVIEAGAVDSSGGEVRLVAAGGNIVHSGTINASSQQGDGGSVRLESDADTLVAGGTIDVSGGGGQGGQAWVLGDRVALYDGAQIHAPGFTGGGEVLIGGDFQGANPDIRNASRTYVGFDTKISADATGSGDGGRVIVWSDHGTQFYGHISARGGPDGGDGGFAEVSGLDYLDFQGLVDLRAPNGAIGTLLLDPTDIVICDSCGGTDLDNSGGNPAIFSDADDSGPSTLEVSTLTGQLVLSNVIVTTASGHTNDGNITVQDAITYTSTNSLTLDADNNITIDAAITNNGTGALSLFADNAIAVNAAISLNGGALTTESASFLSGASGTLSTGGGSITLTANAITLGAAVSGTGSVTLQPLTPGNSIGIAGASGDLQLTTATLGQLLDGFSQIFIGRSNSSGGININEVTFNDPVTLRSPDGGTITVNDTLTGAGNASITLIGSGTTVLTGDIITAGQNITITDNVRVEEAATVTLSTGTSGGGNILIDGTLDGTAGNADESLQFISGSGTATVSGAVGTTDPLDLILQSDDAGNTGAVAFNGAVNALSLTSFAHNYAVALNGGGTVTAATTFANTGGVTLGNDTSDLLTFTGGLTSTASTTTLAGTVTTADTALTLGASSLAEDTVLNAGTSTLTIAGVSGSTFDLTLTADEIELTGAANSITGSGALVLQPFTVGQAIEIAGAGMTAALDLTALELATIADGHSGITIGRSNGSGGITVNAVSFSDPVTLRSPAGGTLAVNGTLAGIGDASITLLGSGMSTVLGADITTEGQFILIDDAVTLTTGVLLSTAQGGQTAGANITIQNPGTVAGGGNSLTLDAGTGGDITVAGAVTGVNDLTVTHSGSTSFQDAVSATTVTLSNTTGTISFAGLLTATTLNTAAQGYGVTLNGGATITNAVTFSNTGAVVLGDADTDVFSFAGGVTATAASGITLAGSFSATDAAITFGDGDTGVTLAAHTTLVTNATATNTADISLGAVSGSGFNLTLETGSVANADVSGTSLTGLGALTLQNIGGTVSFTGAITATSLAAGGTVNNVSLTGSGSSIASAVAFANTGTLTLGQNGGMQTYTGGLSTTSAGGLVTLHGTLQTTDTDLTVGAVTLGSAVTLSSCTGTITAGTITAGANNLTLTGDEINFTGGNNSVTGSGTVTLQPGTIGLAVNVAGADVGAGTLDLTTGDLDALADGLSSIVLGHANGDGLVTVSAYTFRDPVTIQSGGATGDILIAGAVATTGNTGVTLSAGRDITLNSSIATGDVTVSTGGNDVATTGSITVTAGGAVTGNASGTLTTGAASSGGGGDDTSTSGAISVSAAGAVQLAAADALKTGNATVSDKGGSDTESIGSISVNGQKLSSDGGTGPVDVSIGAAGTPGTGTTNNGVLNVTTTGGAGDAGGIFVTSGEMLRVGALVTDGTSSQNISISTTNQNLTLSNAADSVQGDQISFDAGTARFEALDTSFNFGDGSLTITADNVNLAGGAGSITGTGDVVLRPTTLDRNINLENGTAGFDLQKADIDALSSTINSLTIGRPDATGGTLVYDDDGADFSTFNYDLYLYGGSVEFSAGTVLTGGPGVTISVTAVTGDITDAGENTATKISAETILLTAAGSIGTDTSNNLALDVAGVSVLSIDAGESFNVRSTDSTALTDLLITVDPSTGITNNYRLTSFSGLTFTTTGNVVNTNFTGLFDTGTDVVVDGIVWSGAAPLNISITTRTGDLILNDNSDGAFANGPLNANDIAISLGTAGGDITLEAMAGNILDGDTINSDDPSPGANDFNLVTTTDSTVTLTASGSVGQGGANEDIDISGAGVVICNSTSCNIFTDTTGSLSLNGDPRNEIVNHQINVAGTQISIDETCADGNSCINLVDIDTLGFDFSYTGLSGDIFLADGAVTLNGGDFTLEATQGGIYELSNNTTPDITTTGTVTLIAATAVGTAASSLDVEASTLAVQVTGDGSVPEDPLDPPNPDPNWGIPGDGGIYLADTGGVTLTDISTFDGPIVISSSGLLAAVSVVSLFDSADNDISLTGVGIAVGTVDAGTLGDVLLDAGTGAITDDTSSVTGAQVTLAAGMGIGTDVAPINVATTRLVIDAGSSFNVDAGANDLTELTLAVSGTGVGTTSDILAAGLTFSITNGGGANATLNLTDTTGLDLGYTASDGDLVLGTVDVTGAGSVDLTAVTGAITDGNAGDPNITAQLLTVTASGFGTQADPVETAVSNLEAVTGAGGLFVVNTGGLIVGGASGDFSGVSSTTGDISITALSPLTLTEAVSSTGGGSITLAGSSLAVNDSGVDPEISVTGAGTITANIAGTTTLNADVEVVSAGGAITFNTDKMVMDTGVSPASINAGVGSVVLAPFTAGFAIDLGSATDGQASTLELSDDELDRITAGAITVGNGAAGDITVTAPIEPAGATTLNLDTGGSVLDGNAVGDDLTVANLAITAGGAIGSGADPLEISVDSLTTDTSAGGSQFISEANGLTDLDLNAGAGSITLTVALGGIEDLADDGTDILAASVSITLQDPTPQNVGAADNHIETSVDSLTVSTATAGGSQFITEASGLTDLNLNAASGAVHLTLTAGSIIDSDGAPVDVTAQTISLRTPAGAIGASGNPIEVAGVQDLSLSVQTGFFVAGDGATNLTDLAVTIDSSQPGGSNTSYVLTGFPNVPDWGTGARGLYDECCIGAGEVTIFGITATTTLNLSITNIGGDIYLTDAASTGAAAVSLPSGGNITITASDGNIFDFQPFDSGAPFDDSPGTDFNLRTTGGFTVTLNAPGNSVGTAGFGDIDINGTGSLAFNAEFSNISTNVPLTSLDLTFDPANDVVNFNLSGATTVSINELCADGNVCIDFVHNSGFDLDFSLTAESGDIFIADYNGVDRGIWGIGAGDVSLTAEAGGIFGLSNSGITGPDGVPYHILTSGTITLTASTGNAFLGDSIGTAAIPIGLYYDFFTPLPQAVDLVLNRTDSGDIHVTNNAELGLELNGFSSAGGGATVITSHSSLLVNTDIVQDGDIFFDVTELASSTGNLTVAAGATLQSTSGSVTLRAADHVILLSGSMGAPTVILSDSGTVLLSAGFNSTADGQGDLTIGDFVTISAGATSADAVTLRGITFTADTAGNTSIAAVGAGGGIRLFTASDTQTMAIGGTGATFSVSDGELALFTDYDLLTIGESGMQSGLVTLVTVTNPVADGDIVVNANAGAGSIVLNDEGSATALDGGSGNITLNVGSGGILATNASNGFAEIATAGSVTLNTSGAIGSGSSRIQFAHNADPTQQVVTIGSATSAHLDGLGTLTLDDVATTGLLWVTARGDLNVTGAVATGTGQLALYADATAAGLADDGIGTLNLASGSSLTSGSASAAAIILRGADIEIDTSITPATVTTTNATGGVLILSSVESRPISIGGSNTAVAGINLTDDELGRIMTQSSGTIGFGFSGFQTGDIVFTTATPATTAGASVTAFTSGTGGIILDDEGTGTALNGNGGSITLTAGAGGILAAGPNNGFAEVATTGASVTLNTAGPIGTATDNIEIANNGNTAQQVLVIGGTATPSGVFLHGLGTLTLGGITTAGDVDVTAVTAIALTGNISTIAGTDAGNVVFGGPVVIAGGISINTNHATGADGDVSFVGSINADDAVTFDRTLSVNAGTGSASFGGNVGGNEALAQLSVTAGAIALNAASYSLGDGAGFTSLFSGPVTLGTGVTIGAGSNHVTFGGTVNGAHSLAVNTSGATTFTAAVGGVAPLASLTTDAGGTVSLQNVTTSGIQNYGDNATFNGSYITTDSGFTVGGTATLAGAVTVNTGAGAGDIVFTGTVNGTVAGAQNLDLTAGTGSISFMAAVGAGTRLGVLTINSANDVTAGDLTLAGLNQVAGSGTTTLNGAVNTNGAGGVSLTSGTITLNGSLITSGAGPVSLTADTGDITLGEIVAAGQMVTLDAAGAIVDAMPGTDNVTAASLDATAGTDIGLETAVGQLSADAGGNITIANTGPITFTDVSAGGSVNLASDGHILIGLVTAATTVDIESTAGSINDLESEPDALLELDISGTTITLTAAAGVGDTAALELDGTGYVLSAGTGGIGINDLSGATVTLALTADGSIFYGTAGNILVASVVSNLGDVTLESGGYITDASVDTLTDINGNVVTLTAADGIGLNGAEGGGDALGALEIESSSLSASTSNPGLDAAPIVIRDIGGTTLTDLGTVASAITVVSTSGNLELGTIGATGTPAPVSITALSGALTNGGGVVTGSEVSLSSTTGIGTLADPIEVVTADLTVQGTAGGDVFVNIDSGGGSTVEIVSGNNVSLQDLTGGMDLAGAMVSGTLNVTTNGGITDSGTLVVAGIATFAAGAANNITLDSAANNFATVAITSGNNVTLVDTSSIDLGASTISGALDVTASGAITDSGNLLVTGATTLAPGTGNSVVLDSAGNNFTGPVSVTDGASVTLVDINTLDLGPFNITGNLTVTATTGNITDSGALLIGGNSSVTANAAGASIFLDDPGNAFTGTVTFLSAGGLNHVTIVDTTALDLASLALSGNLSVTAAGITDSGFVIVGGTTTLTPGAGNSVVLDNASNNFGGLVHVTNGANATLVDSNTLNLGDVTITGNLSATALAGNITGSGALSVDGTSSFFAASGASISLGNAGNAMTGAVSFTALSGTLANVLVANSAPLALNALTLTGNLTVTAPGVTDNGVLTVPGVATFDAGAADVVLDTPGNDFGTVVIVAANNVDLVDASALVFGVSTINGSLSLQTTGNVTQTGALTVTGAATIDTNNNDIVLNHAGNDFMDAVAITDANDVSWTDANNLELGAHTITGNLTVVAQSIGSSGALVVDGDAAFTAAAGQSISLSDPGNAFGGSVSFTGSGGNLLDVTVFNTAGLDLQALTLDGDLTVTADGTITDSGVLMVGGTAFLDAAGNDIVLDDANDFGGVSIVSGNNVTLNDVNALDLAASMVGGDLTVTAGSLTGSGIVIVTGLTTLTTTGDITLDNPDNDFMGTVMVVSALNATLADVNDLLLDTVTVAQNVTLLTGGSVLDGNDGGTPDAPGVLNISAASLDVTAVGQFGTDGNRIELDVPGSIAIAAADIYFSESQSLATSRLALVSTGTVDIVAPEFVIDEDLSVPDASLFLTTPGSFIGGNGVITANAMTFTAGVNMGTISDPVRIQIANPDNFHVGLPVPSGLGIINADNFGAADFIRVLTESAGRVLVLSNFSDLIASVQGSFIETVGFTVDASQFRTDINIFGVEGAGLLLPPDQLEEEEDEAVI